MAIEIKMVKLLFRPKDPWTFKDGYDSKNDNDLVDYYIEYLDKYLEAKIPVFDCEYARDSADSAYDKANDKGYIPYCTRRSLSKITTTPPPGY